MAEDCARVVTLKVPLDAPSGMFIVEGTVAIATLLLDRATSAPPAGAGPLSVTVPVDVVPPETLVGESTKDVGVGDASKVRVPVTLVLSG